LTSVDGSSNKKRSMPERADTVAPSQDAYEGFRAARRSDWKSLYIKLQSWSI